MFGPFKKEKPLQGFMGFGGGAAAISKSGGAMAPQMEASGGLLHDWTDPASGNLYRFHMFINPGTFTVNDVGASDGSIHYAVVGGGGGSTRDEQGAGGGFEHVMIHELWPSLSRYLPKQDLTRYTKEFKTAQTKYLKQFEKEKTAFRYEMARGGRNYKKGTDDRADAVVIARAGEFLLRNKDNEGFLTEKIVLVD